VFCSLEMPCLLQSPDRILPCVDFDEAESSSKSGDMNTGEDSSLSLSADETEDIPASRDHTSLFEYAIVSSQVVNRFSPPPNCSSDYELVAAKNNSF